MCECVCTCLYVPGKCGVPIAHCRIGWLKSGWWSLSTIQPGQGLLCDRRVRADEFARLTEETKPAVPSLDSSHGMMRFMYNNQGMSNSVHKPQTALPTT